MKNLLSEQNGLTSYLYGKISYYIFLYAAYLALFIAFVFPFFEIPVAGSIVPITVISMLFLTTIALLAILIGTFIKSQIRMMEILAFTTYPFFLISGYSWPVSAMPEPIQWLSYLVPTTPMLEAMTRLFIMGGGWTDVLGQFQHLLILFAVIFAGLIMRFVFIRSKLPGRILE